MNIKSDSRKIVKGDTFIALKGVNDDGHNYIENAILNGASKIICEEGNYSVETIIVPNTREYLINYLDKTYSDKISNIIIIGITGTNGKTTSSFLTYQLLNSLGLKTSYIGTIGFYLNSNVEELKNTTPDILDLYEMILKSIENNCKVIVMEVSSQAIAYKRIGNLKFDIGCFTNLTIDHLDFHKTMKEYKKCKKQLFKKLKNNKLAIINSDDKSYKDFIYKKNNNILYGINGDYKITDYELNINNTNFNFEFNNKKYKVNIEIPGKYNIYNYMNSLIIAHKLGFKIKDIIKKSCELKSPNGRFDIVSFNNNIIIIDYAHTPDALENIINSVNEYKKGKIITIIGCGGNRDNSKRSIMGDLAVSKSEYVIFTNDNPRFEDERKIMNDIVSNIKSNNYEIIYNREEAIKKGINLLTNNDTLLVLGKGHENYQIIGNKKYHFSDKEIVNKIVNKKNL